MRIIKPEESDKFLRQEIGKIETCQQAVERFLSFYETYKTKQRIESDEEDMLLFQYGSYDWDGSGEQFELNLTRQFEILGEDEFLQLRMTLYYDTKAIGQIEPFNTWSVNSKSLNDWRQMIEGTAGFRQAAKQIPTKVEITLSQT